MREIKFRARTINGEFVYGLLGNKQNLWFISNAVGSPFAYEVRPETIGQFTGLKDKNGKEIFEGDILEYEESKRIFKVEWCNEESCYFGYWINGGKPMQPFLHRLGGWELNRAKIIGNIYSTPELLNPQESK